jgi:hypothetical protein
VYTVRMSDSKASTQPEQPSDPAAKPRKELPLVSVPNDRDLLAEEMEELFEEDRVTHVHGGTEPEAE